MIIEMIENLWNLCIYVRRSIFYFLLIYLWIMMISWASVIWICENAWMSFDNKLLDRVLSCIFLSYVLKTQHHGAYFVFTWWGFQAGPDDSLKDVALKILQNGVATVPILHSLSVDASNPHLLHLASLSGILKCEDKWIPVSMYAYVCDTTQRE